MNIWVMRHGQTNYNLRQLCNDDPRDDVHLTENGVQQALAAALQLHSVDLRVIYCSPLPRTRQTAALVAQNRDVLVEPHADLSDIRSGYNGRPVRDYEAAIAHDPLHASVNGGESLMQHKQRVLRFIEWLTAQPQETVLVIAHEETLRVFAAYFRGLDDETMRLLAFGNCELVRFEM